MERLSNFRFLQNILIKCFNLLFKNFQKSDSLRDLRIRYATFKVNLLLSRRKILSFLMNTAASTQSQESSSQYFKSILSVGVHVRQSPFWYSLLG